MKTRGCVFLMILAALIISYTSLSAAVDNSKPVIPIKLIFIHHSTGGNWLADDNNDQPWGGLGTALKNNNYYVSATNYGWGPGGIGDTTDIPNWPNWFTGINSSTILPALYNESRQNIGDFGSWSRLPTDPGGENQIIVFKSCFPNSDLYGETTDGPAETINDQYTVSNAKAVYNNLLTYFQSRQDKLFIVVTAPPQNENAYASDYQTPAQRSANARAFNNWLVNDWLDNYPYSNVAVFDYYNVLTAPENHHRWVNNQVEHIVATNYNYAAYPTNEGDSHPDSQGQQKATVEFVDLLNYFYNRWQAGQATDPEPDPKTLTRTQVSKLYVAIFGRASENEGNAFWQVLEDMESAATAMLDTDAARSYFGGSLDSDQAFIEHIYRNTLNKNTAEDPGGISFWVSALNGGYTRGKVVATLVGVIEDYAPGGPNYNPNDVATIVAYHQFTNRVEVSNYMADQVQNAPSDWATSTRFGLNGLNVTDDETTVTAAKIKVDAMKTTTGDKLLQPANLLYQGAFRLPEDFNWGGRGLSFYPKGDQGQGSLLVTGFQGLYDPEHPQEACWDPEWNCYAWYGQVTIPAPVISTNWESLPEASLIDGMTHFDNGLVSTLHREYVYVSDIQFVPRQGIQTQDKIYGAAELWYAEGVMGEQTFPTIWMANLDGSDARGLFHVGPEESPFHGRKMGAYLFDVPQWYADQYLGGRTLVTGRSRGTPTNGFEPVTIEGGSQGPTLFAFRPFDNNDPVGHLDALPFLYYRVKFPGCAGPNVGDATVCDYPDYTMCDEWTGGVFAYYGGRQAIMLIGYKGLGTNCYDEPPTTCNDPCSDAHGYHCYPYIRQVVFYDVEALGKTATGGQYPWSVLPYAVWQPNEFFLQGNTCWNSGGMAFDVSTGRVFMVERGLEGETNRIVIHVWRIQGD